MSRTAGTVQQALEMLDARLRRRWLLLVPWAVVSAAFEMIATAGMLLLIRLISDPAAIRRVGPVTAFRDWMGRGDDSRFTALLAAGLGIFYLLKNILRVAETYAQQRCATDTALWISSGLLERYLRAPYSLHLRRNSSEMLNTIGAGANQVSWVVLQSATALVSESLVVAGILSVLVLPLPRAAAAVAASTAALMIFLLWMTQHRHTTWGRILHEGSARLLQNLRQSLAAVKEAKILGREPYFVARFAAVRSSVGAIETVQQTIETVPRLVVETIFVATLAILIVLVSVRREDAGNLVPTLGIFAYGSLRLLPSLHLIVYRFNRIGSGAAAVEAVAKDWHQLGVADTEAIEPATPSFSKAIVFEDVSFNYGDAGRDRLEPALYDVSLTIRRGESIGIVGSTGAGKTTLVDLMLGLLEPSRGSICVDGQDIRRSPRSWQRQIGYVPQSVYLIDDTIRRNIALGVEDREIDEPAVMEAARAAQLEEFLRGLPEGLDTVAGERGVKLSGGERQRIAVARALYRRPAVLVFDEATAALDSATEQALTATLRALPGGLTTVFIAHRLTTVQACNRLVLLSGGRIADIGTYRELLQRNPEFRKLALSPDAGSIGISQ